MGWLWVTTAATQHVCRSSIAKVSRAGVGTRGFEACTPLRSADRYVWVLSFFFFFLPAQSNPKKLCSQLNFRDSKGSKVSPWRARACVSQNPPPRETVHNYEWLPVSWATPDGSKTKGGCVRLVRRSFVEPSTVMMAMVIAKMDKFREWKGHFELFLFQRPIPTWLVGLCEFITCTQESIRPLLDIHTFAMTSM